MKLHTWIFPNRAFTQMHGEEGGRSPARPSSRAGSTTSARRSRVATRARPLELKGTTFFVTDGIESALEQAKTAAGGKDVALGGGADAAQQYLAAGLVDELEISVAPVLLGAGARLFGNLGEARPKLEQIRAIEGAGVAHLKYRVR